MRKIPIILIILCMLFSLTGQASADSIIGIASDNGSTTQVGQTEGDAIKMYIPLEGSAGIYGVSDSGNYGLVADTAPAELNGPIMDMFVYFEVPDAQYGHTLTLDFIDLDLEPYNDPTYAPNKEFHEKIFFNGEGGLPSGGFINYDTLDALSNIDVVADFDGSLITFSNLYFAPGDHWINMGFQAYSENFTGTWKNTVENMTPTLTTSPIPEPATMLLFGTGLLGLAAFGRKKFIK